MTTKSVDEKPVDSLLEKTANDLLNEFGMGNPTPGSGSAVAFNCLISAKLILTFIHLTCKDTNNGEYDEWIPEFQRMKLEVEKRIYPQLKKLFDEDSREFKKYLSLRAERKRQTDPSLVAAKRVVEEKQLMVVTESPLSIVKLSKELADYAMYVVRHGFKHAKGDAAVALNNSIASIRSSLTIVDLNLSEFGCSEWTARIRKESNELHEAYNILYAASEKFVHDFTLSTRTKSFERVKTELQSGKWEGMLTEEKQIEDLARQVQLALWENKDFIWSNVPDEPYNALQPEAVIENLLGYSYGLTSLGTDIGEDGREFEVAGTIDKSKKLILVSSTMRSDIQNFTAAHELGHALLHKDFRMHRDRPLDGSTVAKTGIEWQADKFATYFLMPTRQVIKVFNDLFLTDQFVINEATVLDFGEKKLDKRLLKSMSAAEFRTKVGNLRGLSLYLAQATVYRLRPFSSMTDIFHVSPMAMARRLEELNLVRY